MGKTLYVVFENWYHKRDGEWDFDQIVAIIDNIELGKQYVREKYKNFRTCRSDNIEYYIAEDQKYTDNDVYDVMIKVLPMNLNVFPTNKGN